MKGKRTGIEFENHELIISKTDNCMIHYLKKPNTMCDSIRYINAGGILAITGDYGNWIFCREFDPNTEKYVSAEYWYGKLQNSSTQNGKEWDAEETEKDLKEALEEYKSDGGKDEAVIEYYEECINKCSDYEFGYTAYAYGELPDGWDSDSAIMRKDYQYWLKAVFDGFEEVCRRLEASNSENNV